MKAITLHAPWGTLLHTRKPPTDIGERTLHRMHDLGIPQGLTGAEHPVARPPMVKRFETRSWPCPPSIIGQRIAIHQAKTTKALSHGWHIGDWRVTNWDDTGWHLRDLHTQQARIDLPLGCIVASGVITRFLPIVGHDCNNRAHVCHVLGGGLLRHLDLLGPTDDTEWDITDQLPYGDWSPGRWAWELSDVEACEPMAATGRQGFWTWAA